MIQHISKLVLYRDFGEDDVIQKIANDLNDLQTESKQNLTLIGDVYAQVNRLLNFAVKYGLSGNVWKLYVTYVLMKNENPFTMICERASHENSAISRFALEDMKIFWKIFHYNFGALESQMEFPAFSVLQEFEAPTKKQENGYYTRVRLHIEELSQELSNATDEQGFFNILLSFYERMGVGEFGLFSAFRIATGADTANIYPVHNADAGLLSDLVGYEMQKHALRKNTKAFLEGKPSNHVLLYGDSGTGKSSSVKALLTEYEAQGLRILELHKHQFQHLSAIISKLKERNYHFIIFIDDLSFEENEVEYKYLKAIIEGGVETKPENVLIYATSNRRNLIRETWKDRTDMEHLGDVHRSDTVEETLSLSSRFGVRINYNAPNREEYQTIVKELANRLGISIEEEELIRKATQWELRHGGLSGRTAQQFLNDLAGEDYRKEE